MKIIFTFILCSTSIQFFGCHSNVTVKPASSSTIGANTDTMRLKIIIGPNTFTATLHSNPTAIAFKKKLPMTIAMKELNGNEKYGDLSGTVPSDASNPGTIQTGDLMLYGSNTLVLFYKTFETSYSYTRLGHIENPSGLAAALGTGNVTVTLELE